MPLFTTARFFFSLISLMLWAGAGYLLGTWYEGAAAASQYGAPTLEREHWRLGFALFLISYGALGRFVVLAVFSKPSARLERFDRGAGEMLALDDGTMIYHEDRGDKDAPTVIFCHGQGLNSTVWNRIRRGLHKHYRVVSWDLPGLGESNYQPMHDYGVEHAAGALRQLIGHCQSERVLLVGHSFGAMAIQELSQSDPDFFASAVSGVVLMHTTPANPLLTMAFGDAARALQKPLLEPGAKGSIWLEPIVWAINWQGYWSGAAHLANRMQYSSEVSRTQLEHTTLAATKNPPSVLERRNLAMYRWRGLQSGGANMPALIISGERDIVTKAEAGAQIVAKWRGARLQIIEGANHLTPFERPQEYAKAILEFAQATIAASREPGFGDIVALSLAGEFKRAPPASLH